MYIVLRLLLTMITFHSNGIAYSQVSEVLYKSLADSIRPIDRNCINVNELLPILGSYYELSDSKLRDELVELAKVIGPRYEQITDLDQQAQLLNMLGWFWYQRNEVDSVFKYTNLSLQMSNQHVGINRERHVKALKLQAYTKMGRGDFSDAYALFQEAIRLAQSINSQEQISDCLSGELMIFEKLHLYDRVISKADSTLKFVANNTNPVYNLHLRHYLILIKSRAYIAKYYNQKSSHVAEHAQELLKGILARNEPSITRWRIEAFTELSRLAYYQDKYQEAIIFADSAFNLEGPSILENTNRDVRHVYKALSLIQLGGTQEGMGIINSFNRNIDADYNQVLLPELINNAIQQNDYKSAFLYQNELLDYHDRNHILEQRAAVFELENKNTLLLKDIEIIRLQKKEDSLHFILIILLSQLVAFAFYYYHRRKMYATQLKALLTQLNDLTEVQLLKVQEAERKVKRQIAQDLHDDLSASISASSHFLNSYASKELDPSKGEKFKKIAALLHESYHKVRSMSHLMYNEKYESQFFEELINHIHLSFSGSTIEVSHHFEVNNLQISLEAKIALLLTIKESITNILKYAQATQVEIYLYPDLQWLYLTITDNGKGIHASKKSGIGLSSIAERIASLEGTFSIQNRLEGGTCLEIRLPHS